MMLLLNPEDPLELLHIKIELANARHFLLTTDGHRAELDRAIGECFRKWDAITNNTKGAA